MNKIRSRYTHEKVERYDEVSYMMKKKVYEAQVV